MRHPKPFQKIFHLTKRQRQKQSAIMIEKLPQQMFLTVGEAVFSIG